MKAITLDAPGTSPVVSRQLPILAPGAGEVLVRVRASSVNPVDGAIAGGVFKDMVEHDFPVTLGRDYAGTVEQIGTGVAGLSVGDQVFGFVPPMSPVVHDGSWAELIVVPEGSIARKPEGVDLATAGVAPLAGVIAITAVDALEISPDDMVLIVGATGGVGSFAVQLTAAAGATVIAPALPEDARYLRDLGVTELQPRNDDAAALRARHPDGIDALLDTVSRQPGTYDAALKAGARVASPNPGGAGDGPGRTDVRAIPSSESLQRLGELLEDGTPEVHIQHTYPLDEAPQGMQALRTKHNQGKLAIQV